MSIDASRRIVRRRRAHVLLAAALMVGATSVVHGVGGGNLLANSGLESGAPGPWTLYGDATMRVVNTQTPEGDHALEVTVTDRGANPWDSGLSYPNLAFEAGKLYRLTALLRSPDGMRITFKPSSVGPLWTAYGDRTFTLTDAWQRYTIVTPVITSDVIPAELQFHIAFDVGTLLMDDVDFSALATPPSHPGSNVFDDARPRQKGIAYSSWMSGGYSTPAADRALAELESTGATWISLLVVGFQDTISSTDISARDDLTTTDEDLAHAIGDAHRRSRDVRASERLGRLEHLNGLHQRLSAGGVVGIRPLEEGYEVGHVYAGVVDHAAQLGERAAALEVRRDLRDPQLDAVVTDLGGKLNLLDNAEAAVADGARIEAVDAFARHVAFLGWLLRAVSDGAKRTAGPRSGNAGTRPRIPRRGARR